MKQQLNPRIAALLVFFLLATTLFNTMRANSVAQRATTFRKETVYQQRLTRRALARLEENNLQLRREIAQLREALVPETNAAPESS